MRFPWQQRADQAEVEALETEKKLERVLQDWIHVRYQAQVVKNQAELNNWTKTIKAIFEGR